MWDTMKQPTVCVMGFSEERLGRQDGIPTDKSSNLRNLKKTTPRIIIIKLLAISDYKKNLKNSQRIKIF